MITTGNILHADIGAWPVLIFIAVAIAIAILAALQAHKRRKALEALAASKGLRFFRHDPFNLPNLYGQSGVCSQGHSRKARNVIAGDLGEGEVRYFDYKYTTGSGKNKHTYHKSICAFHTQLHFARMVVRPESVFDKVAGFFGFDDVDLDHAEFNRKFYVGSKDKKFAYDILTQRVMEMFLTHPGVTMEMGWNYYIFHYNGSLSVDKVARLIDTSADFVSLLPHYIKKERGLSTSAKPRPPKEPPPAPPANVKGVDFDGIVPKTRRKRS